MFSVYGTSGLLFRGSMEQLRQIGGVAALARIHNIQAQGRDGNDAQSALPEAFTSNQGESEPVDELHRNALTAYVNTQTMDHPRHPLTEVQDVMSRQVITLPESSTVLQAWRLLADKKVGQAPVVDAGERLIGLLTRADLLKPDRLPSPDSHVLVWHAMMMQNVKDIMWTPVPCVAPSAHIRRVARVLLGTGLPGLPVVDEHGLVIGFVSRTDILRAVVTDPPLDLWG